MNGSASLSVARCKDATDNGVFTSFFLLFSVLKKTPVGKARKGKTRQT
jgi:hypothetical protein